MSFADNDATINELSTVFQSLFSIKDEHDLIERPLLTSRAIELLDRTIQGLTFLAELAEVLDPEIASKHRDDIKCFTEMKTKLEATQQEECRFWLSGTFH